MEVWTTLLHGFYVSISPENLLACTVGVLLGTLAGVLPGIGPVGAIALLLPLSFSINVTSSLIMFAGIFYGAMYGGSTTSILLNLPGEAASVVTCIDGNAMAKQGRAGAALAVAAIGSFIAGTLGVVGLTLFAPLLANAALVFGPAEYFAIAVLGLIILTRLTGRSMLKSALMAVIGIILGTVGLDNLTGVSRFSYVFDELQRGMEFAIVAMGLFGVSEVLDTMIRPPDKISWQPVRFRELYPSWEEWRRSLAPIFRGGTTGFLVGLLPGPAATISTFVSYALEKKLSKHPEQFGKGAIEGVAGPEAANNAAASATMIPLLSLGLPFSGASAILLSGFMIHGVTPGPTMVTERPDLFWGLIASMYLGNVLLLIINLPMVGMFAYILKTPANILMPLVLIITMAGAYSLNNSVFDLWLLAIFGLLGFFMRKTGFEPAPLAVGLMLGPALERGLVQGLLIGNGDIWTSFARPISGTLLAIAFILILFNVVRWVGKIRYGGRAGTTHLDNKQ
ncbi:MAG TPA: tripartite tricarboxylate transporter permease [Methylomusa anaerophila]|nr:tripartite tricarboxylate transporter permease [Methylomusa anaerophila]